jgi:hypothetical protein
MVTDPWTLWTARISFLFYALSLGLRLTGRERPARAAWSAGFVVFVAHMFAAFQFVHHWSHADAYAETARKTAALTSLDWGGGLYMNYLLAVVWLADVLWWLWRPANYLHRPSAIEAVVQGYFAFLWFNATVVFGHGPIRPLGAIAFGLLAILAVNRLRRRLRENEHGKDTPLPNP